MTTQVFRAKTLIDARQQAAQVLGKGAVILTTREVKRAGIGGLFGGTDVEVAAAVESRSIEREARLSQGPFALGAYKDAPARPKSTDERTNLAALRAEVRGEMRAMKLALQKTATPPMD